MDESKSTCPLRLRLGKLSDHSEANRRWENQVKEFPQSNSYRELLVIDVEPIEFEWYISTGLASLEILQKFQKYLQDQNIEPENFEGRIIFMSMYNDIEWKAKRKQRCEYNSQTVAIYARKCPRGHWSFSGRGSEKKWYGTYTDKPDGTWDQIAENMMTNFSDSSHPIFRASSAFERRITNQRRRQDVNTLQW